MAAGLRHPATWRAFATVPREPFFGPGPWRIPRSDLTRGVVYASTEDDHPRWLYHNLSLVLDESRHLLSGAPSLVGRWIDELNLQPAERVLQIGSGAGYYTAILSEIVGPDGAVAATEAVPELAKRSRENLANYPSVSVHQGADLPDCREPFDAILMNAGVTHLEGSWLDLLAEGGRLLTPLTVSIGPTMSSGVVLKVIRAGDNFGARVIMPAVGYSATGLRDPSLETVLAKLIATGVILKAGSVRRDPHAPGATCLLHREGACLSSHPHASATQAGAGAPARAF